MKRKTARGPAASFKIPADLLKAFKGEVRVLRRGPAAGYIIFDWKMYNQILVNGSQEDRVTLSKGLKELEASGGQLVVVGPTDE
jgi:hypothetical protein